MFETNQHKKRPKMRTHQQQEQMRIASQNEAIKQLRSKHEQSDEYFNRSFHWKIDFSGSMSVPTNINFHPNHYVGTESELDEIIIRYLRGREDEFKIREIHRFDTAIELDRKFPIKKYKNSYNLK